MQKRRREAGNRCKGFASTRAGSVPPHSCRPPPVASSRPQGSVSPRRAGRGRVPPRGPSQRSPKIPAFVGSSPEASQQTHPAGSPAVAAPVPLAAGRKIRQSRGYFPSAPRWISAAFCPVPGKRGGARVAARLPRSQRRRKKKKRKKIVLFFFLLLFGFIYFFIFLGGGVEAWWWWLIFVFLLALSEPAIPPENEYMHRNHVREAKQQGANQYSGNITKDTMTETLC